MAGRRYHHGDLPAALVAAALDAVAERGVEGLSVADVARRVGVSPGAPYRHFPDRRALLLATAAAAAAELAGDLRAAVDGPTDAEAFAASMETFLRFLVRRRVGWDLLFAAELAGSGDQELMAAGRAVMDELLPRARRVTGDPASAVDLLEQAVALAHGYGALLLADVAPRRLSGVQQVAERVAAGALVLARASVDHHRGQGRRPRTPV